MHAGKKGPIYEVEWNPNSQEFCVIYGCILALNDQTHQNHSWGAGARSSVYTKLQATCIDNKKSLGTSH